MATKRIFSILLAIGLVLGLSGCGHHQSCQLVATTLPVYEFTARLCSGTDITVSRLVTENVSCLHDYTLQTGQMRAIEGAKAVILSGGGLEHFLEDAIGDQLTIDASSGIALSCSGEAHHEGHHHEEDPHYWLDPENAAIMAQNIAAGLTELYPEDGAVIRENLEDLVLELEALQAYGEETLQGLSCRELITFHDGFSYFADAFDLTILKAVEEEAGSEASAKELIELIGLVEDGQIPAIFTERSGSTSAAQIISRETGASVYMLDMAMAGDSYFDAMRHNIDTVKEALS